MKRGSRRQGSAAAVGLEKRSVVDDDKSEVGLWVRLLSSDLHSSTPCGGGRLYDKVSDD
jgi:hypothetical protein